MILSVRKSLELLSKYELLYYAIHNGICAKVSYYKTRIISMVMRHKSANQIRKDVNKLLALRY
jgi:hypothetical protein